MLKQRPDTDPFDIRAGRVMVSLGPLSPKKYCTFSCPFCYVNADFFSYATKTVQEIVQWVSDHAGAFDIIYISGDTDSFAPPRSKKGLDLLYGLSELGTDILFTTRSTFDDTQLNLLGDVAERLDQRKKLLIGCTSISQLSIPHLEPRPIPSPSSRVEQLRKFKEKGLVSVLAMRPFLPIVPLQEYLELVNRVKGFIDIILGEAWYADKAGKLERAVFRGPTPLDVEFVDHKMDFDVNSATWKVYEARETKRRVEDFCRVLGVPFFMRSKPAVEWAREHMTTRLSRLP